MEKITVVSGEQVNGGDTIGIAGDIATLFEPGISFEIRHDTQPVDPLEWVTDKGLLSRQRNPG
jgi:septal ring factor EnvC (AmiA/AmiB activator)